MRNKVLSCFILSVIAIPLNNYAQERLTLQQAIVKTLKQNFDIQMSGIAVSQANANNTYGNAGFSPQINAGINGSMSRNNVQSDLANGSEQNNPNAKNTSLNPAVTASWTVYDGGRMFLVKKQLQNQELLAEYQLKAQIQNTVSRVIQTYARAVLQQKQLVAADTAISLAKTRMKLADLKYTTGSGAKVDLLQAKVDYNARQADSLTYVLQFADACDSLSVLMGELNGKIYKVDDSISITASLKKQEESETRNLNYSLQAFKKSKEISLLNADIAKTYALPTVALSGAYTYSRNTSATGFALFSQIYGASGGFNISVPVFQGGNIRRQAIVASLQAMRDELLFERQNTIIGRQIRIAWRNYNLSVAAYNLAKENIEVAKENVDVQQARFKVGIGTTLESQEAENSFVLAVIRFYTAEYNVKLYETQILELENKLVSQKL